MRREETGAGKRRQEETRAGTIRQRGDSPSNATELDPRLKCSVYQKDGSISAFECVYRYTQY